ncbi:MAG TPA: hypothetical protein VKE49_12395 [Myxococcaceae bacterium]|nr:hypothetical protein [Myxococcaceae bacterium]
MFQMRQGPWLFAVVIWASTASTVAEGQEWSLLTGGTMGVKSGALHVQAGWPSASATLLYGVSPGADLGTVFTFNYAFEGDVILGLKKIGLGFQGMVRARLYDSNTFNAGLAFAPGVLGYPCDCGSRAVGLLLPLRVAFGYPNGAGGSLFWAVDLPFFAAGGFSALPVLFGVGQEILITRNLMLTLNAKAGPIFYSFYSGGIGVGLEATAGLAFRL